MLLSIGTIVKRNVKKRKGAKTIWLTANNSKTLINGICFFFTVQAMKERNMANKKLYIFLENSYYINYNMNKI